MDNYQILAPFLVFLLIPLKAEIVTDGHVGPVLSLSGPEYAIDASLGQQVGNNLFHSFKQFSLSIDESATFSGADNISRIISQVTGGNRSVIDGAINSTILGADIYFLNPAGIIFQKNASLNINGSFYASTADTLKFADGLAFDFNTDSNQLSSAAPSAFGFVGSAADLSVEGSVLAVPTGQNLLLAGANLTLQASVDFDPSLEARGGAIKLVATAVGDQVSVTMDQLEANLQGSQIYLDNATLLTDGLQTHRNGGAITIQGQSVQIDNSFFRSRSILNSDGQALQIEADNIRLTGSTNMSSSTLLASANAGDISITATEQIYLGGVDSTGVGVSLRSNVGTPRFTSASGKGGSVVLKADSIVLEDGASVGSNTYGSGDGGKVQLIANDFIRIKGVDVNEFGSGVYSGSSGKGNAGNVLIQAPTMTLENGAVITVDNISTGKGGTINIVTDNLSIKGMTESGYGSFIGATTQGVSQDAGVGGQIVITSSAVSLAEGGQITSSSLGSANAGSVDVTTDNIFINGQDLQGFKSGLLASTEGSGAGGQISINANTVNVSDGGEINSSTFAGGAGGQIDISANHLVLKNNALITAISEGGNGVAGDINLQLSQHTHISQNSAIETKANGADGGSINFNAEGYVYLRDSRLTTSVLDDLGNSGNGGNINLNTSFVVQDNSPIIARAQQGSGGNILINTTSIYTFSPTLSSPIDASSEFGIDGVVTTNSPDINVTEALLTLSTDFLEEKIVLENACTVSQDSSRFINKPRLGVTNQNDDWLSDKIILPLDN